MDVQVGETLDDDHPNRSFDDGAFEAPRDQFVPEWLEPDPPVFGQAPPMSAAIVLPAVLSLGVDFPEDAVPRVIVSPEKDTVFGRKGGPGRPARQGLRGNLGCPRHSRQILATPPPRPAR